MRLHVTIAYESNEESKNLTSAAGKSGSWTNTYTVKDTQVLPICHWSDIYNHCSFVDIFLAVVRQLEEQLLYSFLSAITLFIICYWKFRNLNPGVFGDNHRQDEDDNRYYNSDSHIYNSADEDCTDNDGHFGILYDERNNIVHFPIAVSETSLLPLNLPDPTSSMLVEKANIGTFSKNRMLMTFPTLMIFMASTRPTCISSGGCTTITSSVMHFQCNNSLILKCPIEVVLGPPSESPTSTECKPSTVLSLANKIDKKEDIQNVCASCHTKVFAYLPDILTISGYLKIMIFIALKRNVPFVQPFSNFLTCSPSGVNCYCDTNTAGNKRHKEWSGETLDSGQENLSSTSDHKQNTISPTLS